MKITSLLTFTFIMVFSSFLPQYLLAGAGTDPSVCYTAYGPNGTQSQINGCIQRTKNNLRVQQQWQQDYKYRISQEYRDSFNNDGNSSGNKKYRVIVK